MKYIHLLCLQYWLDSKKSVEEEGSVTSYIWDNLTCELCKADLDLKTASQDGKQDIELLSIDIPEDNEPFFVIEQLITDKANKRKFYVIDMT